MDKIAQEDQFYGEIMAHAFVSEMEKISEQSPVPRGPAPGASRRPRALAAPTPPPVVAKPAPYVNPMINQEVWKKFMKTLQPPTVLTGDKSKGLKNITPPKSQ